jgi:hypothetical protein
MGLMLSGSGDRVARIVPVRTGVLRNGLLVHRFACKLSSRSCAVGRDGHGQTDDAVPSPTMPESIDCKDALAFTCDSLIVRSSMNNPQPRLMPNRQ